MVGTGLRCAATVWRYGRGRSHQDDVTGVAATPGGPGARTPRAGRRRAGDAPRHARPDRRGRAQTGQGPTRASTTHATRPARRRQRLPAGQPDAGRPSSAVVSDRSPVWIRGLGNDLPFRNQLVPAGDATETRTHRCVVVPGSTRSSGREVVSPPAERPSPRSVLPWDRQPCRWSWPPATDRRRPPSRSRLPGRRRRVNRISCAVAPP